MPRTIRSFVVTGVVTAALAALTTGAVTLSRPTATARAQEGGLQLTVYNQGVALVRDPRTIDLNAGVNTVQIRDVAARIDPTSVLFRDLTDPEGTAVLEQNFEYDLVGAARLLEKYIDQQIRVVLTDGTEKTGTLLSGSGDIILQTEEGGVTVVRLDDIREYAFPSLPEGLITRPTLVWMVEAAQAGTHNVELSYMTSGIGWEANYVFALNEDDTLADLNGWVTLNNQSGATYNEAKLKLIAGDIQRAAQVDYDVMPTAVPAAEMGRDAGVEERSFFEYHLYEVQRPVTVKDKQTKQIEFVSGRAIPVRKYYVYDGTKLSFSPYYGGPIFDQSYGAYAGNTKVDVNLEFTNDEESGLGVPLPRGVIRIYKEDIDGSQQLLGEDTIDHTPRNETLTLTVGQAFDIVGEHVQTNFRTIGRTAVEESFTITLRNRKTEPVEVRVVEHLFRWSTWEILEASQEYTQLDSNTIEFRVQVPADGEATVQYTVRYDQ